MSCPVQSPVSISSKPITNDRYRARSIDKTSSSELSEAINSMYAWYEGSRICYAYLSDVPSAFSVLPMGPAPDGHFDRDGAFHRSRWFTRGWTLQELLAPTSVEFY